MWISVHKIIKCFCEVVFGILLLITIYCSSENGRLGMQVSSLHKQARYLSGYFKQIILDLQLSNSVFLNTAFKLCLSQHNLM
jgi:hypothetical protein